MIKFPLDTYQLYLDEIVKNIASEFTLIYLFFEDKILDNRKRVNPQS